MNSKTALRDKAKNIRKQLNLIDVSEKLVKEIQAAEYYTDSTQTCNNHCIVFHLQSFIILIVFVCKFTIRE